jgi:lysophospholipase L1-like esterase
MIKNIQGPKLGKEVGNRVVVKSFPGATSEDMRHYIKPTIDRSPNRIVLHCGTNDLKNSSPTEFAERVASLASEIEKTSEIKVIISELVARRDMNDQVKTVNKQLRKHCQSNGWTLIQHNNISFADLNRGGLHLNHEGNCKFFKNFVDIVAKPED